jgi:hypothetical protein
MERELVHRVLVAREALLLGRRDDAAVDDERRSRIVLEGARSLHAQSMRSAP